MSSPTKTFIPYSLFAAATASILLQGCASKEPPAPAAVAPPAAKLTLPISLNEIMVGAVDHASDPLFDVGNGLLPKDDAAWREVEYNAYQMVAAGKLIQLAGTGPKDAEWVANADWKRRADDLTQVGLDLVKLAKARDAAGFEAAGNRLVAACEDCHTQFKPDIPTMGVLHKPDFPHKSGK